MIDVLPCRRDELRPKKLLIETERHNILTVRLAFASLSFVVVRYDSRHQTLEQLVRQKKLGIPASLDGVVFRGFPAVRCGLGMRTVRGLVCVLSLPLGDFHGIESYCEPLFERPFPCLFCTGNDRPAVSCAATDPSVMSRKRPVA